VAAAVADPAQNEVRTIVGINGSTILLNAPLTFNHLPPSAGLQVHVANLTRNAVIESESSAIDRRGHVMFMHNREVDVNYGGFYRLGRTNKLVPVNDPIIAADWSLTAGTGTNPRGRYAVHFHRNGTVQDGDPSIAHGSAVVDSPGWGFVNHSSYVDMTDNVAYNSDGAGFVTEAGDEIGSFQRNMSLGSVGSREAANSRAAIYDFGHQGDGFWFQGGGVSVTDNVAAGNTGPAFIYYTRGIVENGELRQFRSENLPVPEIAAGATLIDVAFVPIREFERNIGYSSDTGMVVRYNLLDSTHTERSYLGNSTFWNNNGGVSLPYTERTVLTNIQVLHSMSSLAQAGFGTNSFTRDIDYNNVTVTGHHWGIILPGGGHNVVNGGYFDNAIDFIVYTATEEDRVIEINGPIGFGAAAGGQQNQVSMLPNFELPPDYVGNAFYSDAVWLNYGPFVRQRAYFRIQAADAVPFPNPIPGLPAGFEDLTNQELWDYYGMAIGGEVAPATAGAVPGIYGLVAPLS
jgi:hypothetical protein